MGVLSLFLKREASLDSCWRSILMNSSSEACQLRRGNRSYRSARLFAAHRELARSDRGWYLAPEFDLTSRDLWSRHLNTSSHRRLPAVQDYRWTEVLGQGWTRSCRLYCTSKNVFWTTPPPGSSTFLMTIFCAGCGRWLVVVGKIPLAPP